MPRRKYPRRGFKITPQRGHACTTPKRSAKSIAKINAEKFCREAFFGVKINAGAGLRQGCGGAWDGGGSARENLLVSGQGQGV